MLPRSAPLTSGQTGTMNLVFTVQVAQSAPTLSKNFKPGLAFLPKTLTFAARYKI